MITILAVDDEPLNNEFMRRLFRKSVDRRVLTAPSGEMGLQVLSESSINIILVDYSMPDMSGVEFLERASAVAPQVPALMVTGYPELRDVTEAVARGLVREVVAKPIVTAELFAAIERALGGEPQAPSRPTNS